MTRGMIVHAQVKKTLIVGAALACAAPLAAAPGVHGNFAFAPASYIGVGVMDINDETAREIGLVEAHGIEISSVTPDSPAERAGLREGDFILSYRGERVHGYQHFARLVRETPTGRNVELGVVRDGHRTTLTVEIGERDALSAANETIEAVKQHLEAVKDRVGSARLRIEAEGSRRGAAFTWDFDVPQVRMIATNRRLGTELESLDGQLAEFFGVEWGVLVRHVQPGSIAEMADLRAGDVIVSVGGEPVNRPAEVGKLAAASEQRLVDVEIIRGRDRTTLRFDVASRAAPHPASAVSDQN